MGDNSKIDIVRCVVPVAEIIDIYKAKVIIISGLRLRWKFFALEKIRFERIVR